MKNSDKERFVTVNESRLVHVELILFFIGLLTVITVIYSINRQIPGDVMVSALTSFNALTVMYGVLLALLLLELVRYLLYRRSCKDIMLNGISCTGKVMEPIRVNNPLKAKGSSSDYWSYRIQLPSGEIVETERYVNDFYGMLRKKTCTVYSYNGKYYFTDFA